MLAATPIGNAADASTRLRAELSGADVVAAEDTRRLQRLAGELGVSVSGRVVSYYDSVEAQRTPELLAALVSGARVLLVTDAGTPCVSDPGYRLIVACIEAGIRVTGLPGPSAPLLALTLSGLAVDRFAFEGFLPRKPGERRRRLAEVADDPRTLIFFEAPHRLADALADLAAEFGGDRRAAVCRELTKTYEEVRRGSLTELAEWATGDVRGEITIVVAGAPAVQASVGDGDLAEAVATLEPSLGRKAAIAAVADATKRAKRDVYAAVIAARDEHGSARP